MTVSNIDYAMNNIETGILAGILELALDTNVQVARYMVEEWARNVSEALQNYTDLYPEKMDSGEPLFYETGTMFNALTFVVDIIPDQSIKMYLDIDEGIEPRTGATIIETFGRINYGVTSTKINIPARPIFYDVLDALNQQKIIKMAWTSPDKNAFMRGFKKAIGKSTGTMSFEERYALAKKLTEHKKFQLKAKYTNYYTGTVRWF